MDWRIAEAQRRESSERFRYTQIIVPKIAAALLFTLIFASLGSADDASFRRIRVLDLKGRQNKAVLTFNDTDKAVEVRPTRTDRNAPVNIPYATIDKFSYEFTKKHRVNDTTIVTAPLGIGALVMFTRAKLHWLQIDYRDQEMPKSYVLRMDKKNYLRILDAIKTHTGKDAEVLGNANKR